MPTQLQYDYLESRPGSNYKQLWVKGRHIRAEVLYRLTIGLEPRSPQEVADDYDLPLAVVHEAIDYAIRHKDLLDAERAREEQRIRNLGLDRPPYAPVDSGADE